VGFADVDCGLVGWGEEGGEEVGIDAVAQFAGEGVEVAGRGRDGGGHGGGSHCWWLVVGIVDWYCRWMVIDNR
jgi:hypothetical protein